MVFDVLPNMPRPRYLLHTPLTTRPRYARLLPRLLHSLLATRLARYMPRSLHAPLAACSTRYPLATRNTPRYSQHASLAACSTRYPHRSVHASLAPLAASPTRYLHRSLHAPLASYLARYHTRLLHASLATCPPAPLTRATCPVPRLARYMMPDLLHIHSLRGVRPT